MPQQRESTPAKGANSNQRVSIQGAETINNPLTAIDEATSQVMERNRSLQAQQESLKGAIEDTNYVIREAVESGNFSARIDLESKDLTLQCPAKNHCYYSFVHHFLSLGCFWR